MMVNEKLPNMVYVAAKGVMKGRPHYLLQRDIGSNRKGYHILEFHIKGEGKDQNIETVREIEKSLPGLQYERDFVIEETHVPALFQLFFLSPLEEYMYLGLGKGDYCWISEDKLNKLTKSDLFPTLEQDLTVLPRDLIYLLGERYMENLKTALGEIVDESIKIEGIEKAHVSYLAAGLRRMLINHVSGFRIVDATLSYKLKKSTIRRVHEYEAIPGIQESMREIIANIEKIRIRPKDTFTVDSEGKWNTLEKDGEASPVYAKDLFQDIEEVEVINGNQIIFHRNGQDGSIYTVALCTIRGVGKDFSPVKMVGYKIEGLDGSDKVSILMNIVTDGTRSVTECFSEILTCLGGNSNESN